MFQQQGQAVPQQYLSLQQQQQQQYQQQQQQSHQQGLYNPSTGQSLIHISNYAPQVHPGSVLAVSESAHVL